LYKEGHAGVSFLLFSPLMLFFKSIGADMTYVFVTCVLMVALSSLPDIDMELRKEYGIEINHRGKTHTFLAGILFGIAFSALIGVAYGILGNLMGFIAGFGGTASHLLGDAFTYEPFEPFYPFSKKKIALRKFKSSNRLVNNTMLGLGIFSFIISYEPSIFWLILNSIKSILGF